LGGCQRGPRWLIRGSFHPAPSLKDTSWKAARANDLSPFSKPAEPEVLVPDNGAATARPDEILVKVQARALTADVAQRSGAYPRAGAATCQDLRSLAKLVAIGSNAKAHKIGDR